MNAAGLIFSNIHDSSVPELTRVRTMASVPFGCRYRLIDFSLSNLANAGIKKVGVITHTNYRSLLEHIGSGADWDLERRDGGVKILPPFITAYDTGSAPHVYTSRLEALMGAMSYIRSCGEEYIILSDCDIICNIDLRQILDGHIAGGADISVVTRVLGSEAGERPLPRNIITIKADAGGRIYDAAEHTCAAAAGEEREISLNIMVMRRDNLESLVADAMAHGYNNFYRDIICRMKNEAFFRAVRFDGYIGLINSLESYFAVSMDMLRPDVRQMLLGVSGRPVMTRIINTPPVKYAEGAVVRGSLTADGCVIEGTVENSVLFRGVRIGPGAVVRDCVLMDNSYVGAGASLSYVISDKNVLFRDSSTLRGCAAVPLYVGKGRRV